MDFEICFECTRSESYPFGKFLMSDDDDCRMDLMALTKDFFKKNGIHYGIDSLRADNR